MKICIIGAGIIGLSTAVRLQEELGTHLDITIIADKFGREVVSDAAAGCFVLRYVNPLQGYEGSRVDPSRDIGTLSINRWKDLYKDHGEQTGIRRVVGYDIHPPPIDPNMNIENPNFFDYLGRDKARQLNDGEVQALFPTLPSGTIGYEIDTFTCSPRTYLPWLMTRFKEGKGKVMKRRIDDFDELLERFDIVVNCTGFRAGALTDDKDIVPSRGQIYRANIPEKRGQWFMITLPGMPIQMFDTVDGVALGATKWIGDWSKEFSERDHKLIMSNFQAVLPDLPDLESRIYGRRVEHRPQRSTIRMEKESRMFNGKMKWILHHYGHGASGVALSWGSACIAVEMLQPLINQSKL